jgi:hypothetical protein
LQSHLRSLEQFATVLAQTVDLMNALPKYRENIEAKWTSIQKGPPGPVSLAFRNVGELVNDFGKITASTGRDQEPEPAKVQVVNAGDRLLSLAKAGMTPIAGPADEFFVVPVLVVFMLVERKRLRQRLLGPSHIVTTTLAVDEAGSRLSFLLTQLQVNSGFALVLGIGLYLIGVPNAWRSERRAPGGSDSAVAFFTLYRSMDNSSTLCGRGRRRGYASRSSVTNWPKKVMKRACTDFRVWRALVLMSSFLTATPMTVRPLIKALRYFLI